VTIKVRYWRGVILGLLIATSCFSIFHHFIATRRVAQVAIETAQNSGLLDQSLGANISMANLVHGRIIGGSDGGTADLEIPVYGSRGKGTLLAWEQGGLGSWHICSLIFRSDRGMQIVIIQDETSHCERE
jgi:hypothetical protein